MEQKKILWIFSILTAFLVIVFAICWYFYSPARKQNNTTVTNLTTQQPEGTALAGMDADAWAKNSGNVPTPTSDSPTNITIDNKVTLVTGTDEKNLDVTSLVSDNQKVEGELPKSISNEIIATVNSKDDSKTADKADTKVQETEKPKVAAKDTKPAAKTTPKEKTTVKPKTTAKTTTTAKKTTAAKPKTVASAAKSPTKVYWVQTASLVSRLYAEEARKKLQDKNMHAEIFTKDTAQGLVHRVRVGPFDNKTEANYWLASIKAMEGFEESYVIEEKL